MRTTRPLWGPPDPHVDPQTPTRDSINWKLSSTQTTSSCLFVCLFLLNSDKHSQILFFPPRRRPPPPLFIIYPEPPEPPAGLRYPEYPSTSTTASTAPSRRGKPAILYLPLSLPLSLSFFPSFFFNGCFEVKRNYHISWSIKVPLKAPHGFTSFTAAVFFTRLTALRRGKLTANEEKVTEKLCDYGRNSAPTNYSGGKISRAGGPNESTGDRPLNHIRRSIPLFFICVLFLPARPSPAWAAAATS